MAYIPIPIIIDILIRLPVKSLARFKALNKLSYSIIKDPRFINTHFKKNSTANAADNDNLCLIISYMEHRNLNTIVHFITVKHEHDAIVRYSATVSFDSYQVLPSCNGLICFYGSRGDVHVCNPSTKHIIKLPLIDDAQGAFRLLSCGFGFDETSGMFNVVKFLEPERIEIFTMGNGNNSWRNISYYPPCFTILHHQPPVFAGGFFYWFSTTTTTTTTTTSSIVSFDIGNEIFEPISPPQSISDKDLGKLSLVELRGELCLVDLDYELEQRMGIWVFKKEHYYWVELGSIVHQSEPIDTIRPVSLNGNHEILLHGFIKGFGGPLSCYNLETGGFRPLKVGGISSQYYHVSHHVDSLFQVDH